MKRAYEIGCSRSKSVAVVPDDGFGWRRDLDTGRQQDADSSRRHDELAFELGSLDHPDPLHARVPDGKELHERSTGLAEAVGVRLEDVTTGDRVTAGAVGDHQ